MSSAYALSSHEGVGRELSCDAVTFCSLFSYKLAASRKPSCFSFVFDFDGVVSLVARALLLVPIHTS